MPWSSKGQCCVCRRATHGRLCDACKGAGRGSEERKSAARRGYGDRWRKYREGFLDEHPICNGQVKVARAGLIEIVERHAGVVRTATDVDHVLPVSGPEDAQFWDARNHQALCHACHSWKTAACDGGYGHAGMRRWPGT